MPEQAIDNRPTQHAASCNECKRRKQKCNREWPCRHCQARNVPHLCRFASMRESPSIQDSSSTKGAIRPISSLTSLDEWDRGLDSHAGEDITKYTVDHAALRQPESDSSVAALEKALETLPPRPYTGKSIPNNCGKLHLMRSDVLVQSFLEGANFHYYIIHPSSFLEHYHQWWANRALGQDVSPEVTCCILRVCACSLQYLDTAKQQRIEQEMGHSAQHLTEKYQAAAQHLSQSNPPGEGGYYQVQELLLAAYWYKSEARSVDSWHALGAAIQMAQELAMHDVTCEHRPSEFQQELKRRTWSILYTWDWQMSEILCRPRFINKTSISIELPDPRVDEGVADDRPPSPITPMLLHCRLIQALIENIGDDVGRLPPSEALNHRDQIMDWMDSFPPAYRATDTDTQFDIAYPYVPLQRLQLHATVYGMMLHPLRHYLTRYRPSSATTEEVKLYAAAVSAALSLIEALRNFFNFIYPRYTKFHSISCALFDTAAFLCCALVHDDRQSQLPQRQAIVHSIKDTLDVLRQIHTSLNSKTAVYPVLRGLLSKVPFTADEIITLGLSRVKKAKLETSPEQTMAFNSDAGDQVSTADDPNSPAYTRKGIHLPVTMTELEQRLRDDSLLNVDFDVSDYLVDWENLDSGL